LFENGQLTRHNFTGIAKIKDFKVAFLRAKNSNCVSVFLEKLTGSQLVKKFPHFMEPEGSLPHSQVPATCLSPEPDLSSPLPVDPS